MSLRLHGDALAEPGLLDFAVNTWPAERSAGLEAALRRALSSGGYPSDRRARALVAARHGRDAAEVLAANGACDVFWLLAHALRPKRACCIQPSFTEPEAALRAVGADVVHVLREPERWSFDPAEVPDDAELVVVGNPNNPTGGLDPRDAILALVRPGRLVLVDESFMDFVPGQTESLAAVPLPGLAVLRSLTKLWALAGLRAGYLLAEPALVEQLDANRQPWSVNAVACAALETCAADAATPRMVAAEVAVERAELAAALGDLPGLRVWPGAANFLLLRVPDGPSTADRLRDAGIAVRPAWSFPGLDERYLRVAVRRREDNRRLVEALARCC